MIQEEVIEYLDNENKDLEKKYNYVKRLDLSYADLYDLREMYKHDERVYRMLDSFCYFHYNSRSIDIQLDKEHRKYEARRKMKRMKFNKKGTIDYD